MKKHIIVFPGDAQGVFFKNEFSSILNEYDQIDIVSYRPVETTAFCYEKKVNNVFSLQRKDMIRGVLSRDYIKWLLKKSTHREIKMACSFSLQGVKRLVYILYYGIYGITSYRIVNKRMRFSTDEYIVVYSFWLSRGAYAAAFIKEKGIAEKAVSRAHGYDLYEERNSSCYLPFRFYIWNQLDRIYFISEQGREYFKKRYLTGEIEKLQIARLGTFNPLKLKKIVAGEKRTIVIASCSSIVSVKRIDLIIDLFEGVELPIHWIHIGDGPLSEHIKKMASEKLSHIKVDFLGAVENSRILDTYIEYDVDYIINLSDSEGIPVSIMEAFSIGVPAIARDVGGMSEIVNSDTGLLLDEPYSTSTAIEKIKGFIKIRLEDIEQYTNLSGQCVSLWSQRYNAESNYTEFFKSI